MQLGVGVWDSSLGLEFWVLEWGCLAQTQRQALIKVLDRIHPPQLTSFDQGARLYTSPEYKPKRHLSHKRLMHTKTCSGPDLRLHLLLQRWVFAAVIVASYSGRVSSFTTGPQSLNPTP